VILDPAAVEAIRRRYVGTQLAALAESHQELARRLEAAYGRIDAQSDILARRAEKPVCSCAGELARAEPG
jgi:hypothetical protein